MKRFFSYLGWGTAGALVIVGAFVFTPIVILGSALGRRLRPGSE